MIPCKNAVGSKFLLDFKKYLRILKIFFEIKENDDPTVFLQGIIGTDRRGIIEGS